jgi:predicted transcriptional regulator
MKGKNIEERRMQLRTWLVQSGMSRPQLAERLGVTLASVNNWLSCTNIPEKRWNDIQGLFEQKSEAPRNRIVGTTLTEDEMAMCESAAERLGISKEDFFRESILSLLSGE